MAMEIEKKQAYLPLIAVGNDALIPLVIYRKGGEPSLDPPEAQDRLVRPETLEDLTIKICNSDCGHKFEPTSVSFRGGQIIVELSGEKTNEHGVGVYQVDLTYNATDPSYSDGKRLVHLSRQLCRVVKASDETLTAPKEVTLEVAEGLKGEKGDKGDDAYDTAVKRGLVSTLEQWVELNRGVAGKSAYQEYLDTTNDQPKKSREEWLASLAGQDGKSAYDLAVEAGYEGSKESYLASLKGNTGKSAYQHYLDTTSDEPKLSLQEWLASYKGETGDSAYQSYLKTTRDDPKLTEDQWAKVNDYHTQILHAIIYGTKDMTEKYTGAELYDLGKHLRALNNLLQSRGVGVTEESPLVDLIKAVELAPSFPEAIPVYKVQQFENYPKSIAPAVEFTQAYNKAYYTFWKSKLKTLPPLLGVDKITSAEGMCDSSDVLGVAKVGEAVSLTRMDRMFYGCSSLSVVHISTSPALVNMDMAFSNCGALTSIVGVIDVSNVTRLSSAFQSCNALEEVRLSGLKSSIDLSQCFSLSEGSLRYLVDNATEVAGKTITLSTTLRTRPELKDTLTYIDDEAVEKGFSVLFK